MGIIPPIERNSARDGLTLLATISQPQSEEAARALVHEQGWTIAADAPGDGLIASGTWPGSGEAITFTFEDDSTPDIMIAAFAGLNEEPEAQQTALHTFAMLVDEATTLLGDRTGEILGQRPRAWWVQPNQTLSLSRWHAATTISWSNHEEHDALLRSIADDAS
jgi:hypothetical protein